LIGCNTHQEVIGTIGQLSSEVIVVKSIEDVYSLEIDSNENIAYSTQTTLSVDQTKNIINALHKKFKNIAGMNMSSICYATQNRQNAVKALCKQVEAVFIIGSKHSSNSTHLKELAMNGVKNTYLFDNIEDLSNILKSIGHIKIIGLSAGASVPDHLVNRIIEYLKYKNPLIKFMEIGKNENIEFKLPII
jgi:4-hydroxy-3-methylbut-2-enyl diphosphate reductase